MNAGEFIDYCRTIAAEAGVEPSRVPILDAGLAIQFLIPPIMREAVRRVSKKPNQLQSLVRPHFFTVTNGVADLAASAGDLFSGASGLEEEFSPSFQVGVVPDVLNRTIALVDKASDTVTSPDHDFTDADAGRRVVITVDDAEVVRATIDTVPTDSTLTLTDYLTGATGTSVADGTLYIYDPPTLTEGEFTPLYLNTFSLVEQYADFQAEDTPLLPIFCVRGGRIFVKTSAGINDGTTIVVYGISVPQVTDETTEIDASDDLLDTALMLASSIMRGELPVGTLGIPDSMIPPRMSKK